MFQSLICWKSDSDSIGVANWPGSGVVSILDLLEVGFRLYSFGTICLDFFVFQSLICWKSDSDLVWWQWWLYLSWVSILDLLEVGFRQKQYLHQAFRHTVSILDLLEVGFRRKLCSWDSTIWGGFNPWFVGSRIQTLTSWIGSVFCGGFNPWFVGSRIQTRQNLRTSRRRTAFQSLICWKSDSDMAFSEMMDFWANFVSILDLLEVGFRLIAWFSVPSPNPGFNPWFVGSRIQTVHTQSGQGQCPCVSILDLLEVGFRLGRPAPQPKSSFYVSILDLLEVGFRPVTPVVNHIVVLVSILDLLEVGFRLRPAPHGQAPLHGFNPWFVGSRIQTYVPFGLCFIAWCFNPWFVGSRIQTHNMPWFFCRFPFVSILDLLEVGFRHDAIRAPDIASRWFQSLICWKSDSDMWFHALDSRGWLFQSLICWKSDSDLPSGRSDCDLFHVSILDLLEVGFRQRGGGEPLPPRMVFQSLICWKSDSDTVDRYLTFGMHISFNPWFVGSRIQTQILHMLCLLPS